MGTFIKKIFAAGNWKYYSSELVAYVAAIICSTLSAVLADIYSSSDVFISSVSALGGTVGFLVGALTTYCLLHLSDYYANRRNFKKDIRIITKSHLRGIFATYLFRIPFQFMLQKFGMAPAVAAPIAQVVAGQIGSAVRIYSNYKKKLFGTASVDHPVPELAEKFEDSANDKSCCAGTR
jgi:purine-cytosine permease-like protein